MVRFAARRTPALACVLLAAGGSRRLGHPKQLLRRQGRPLLLHCHRCRARRGARRAARRGVGRPSHAIAAGVAPRGAGGARGHQCAVGRGARVVAPGRARQSAARYARNPGAARRSAGRRCRRATSAAQRLATATRDTRRRVLRPPRRRTRRVAAQGVAFRASVAWRQWRANAAARCARAYARRNAASGRGSRHTGRRQRVAQLTQPVSPLA